MMKQLKRIIMSLAIMLSIGLVFAPTASVGAESAIDAACVNDPNSTLCANKDEDINNLIKNVVNVLLFIVGIISVIVIIVGGIMYSTSGGDAGAVTKAKNTILYAIVGLAVAFFAFAIVNWVVGLF